MHPGDARRRFGLALSLAAVCSLLACARDRSAPPRGIVLISVDTLRADHLGLYGYHRRTSPSLDRFAATATVFERALSTSSWTLPAHVSLMVSRYPAEHGVHAPDRRLKSGASTLAARLGAAGYRTAGFYASGLLAPASGLDQGFDRYEMPAPEGDAGSGVAVNRAALDWLDESDQPFFLFLHYYDVHAPYGQGVDSGDSAQGASSEIAYPALAGRVAERYLRRRGVDTSGLDWRYPGTGIRRALDRLDAVSADPDDADRLRQHHLLNEGLSEEEQEAVIGLYDDGIAAWDRILEQLLSGLKDRGLLDDSLIWLVADHGEMLYDHHGFRDHTRYLNRGITSIPMIVRTPGQQKGGRVPGPAVSLVDVLPTVLDFVGLQPAGRGLSLRPLLEGGPGPPERALPIQLDFDGVTRDAVVQGPWKLIDDRRGSLGRRLYLLEQDPEERVDLADRHPDVVRRLAGEIERLGPAELAEPRVVAPAESEKLRALGYIR